VTFEIFVSGSFLRPVRGTFLAPLFDDFDGVNGFIGVGELLEELAAVWVLHSLCPFAEVTVDEVLHLLLEVGANAEFVVEDHFAQVVDSTG